MEIIFLAGHVSGRRRFARCASLCGAPGAVRRTSVIMAGSPGIALGDSLFPWESFVGAGAGGSCFPCETRWWSSDRCSRVWHGV